MRDQLGSFPLEVEDPQDTGVPEYTSTVSIGVRDEDLVQEVGASQRGQHRLAPFTRQNSPS